MTSIEGGERKAQMPIILMKVNITNEKSESKKKNIKSLFISLKIIQYHKNLLCCSIQYILFSKSNALLILIVCNFDPHIKVLKQVLIKIHNKPRYYFFLNDTIKYMIFIHTILAEAN